MILVGKHHKPLAEARFDAAFEQGASAPCTRAERKDNGLKPHSYLVLLVFRYRFCFQLKSFRIVKQLCTT
jgi:hypothetical protein